MYLRAFLFSMGMFLGACCAPGAGPPAAPPPSRLGTAGAQALAARTVALVKLDPEEGIYSFCSGVWVSPSVILTAEHCVDEDAIGDPTAYLTEHDSNDAAAPRPAVILAHDEAHDLALVRAFAPPSHDVAELRIETVEPGMRVQAMGHPIGMRFSYSSGDVAAVRVDTFGLDKPITWVQTTTPVGPGSSGGGLFDGDARLVGISSRVLTGHAQNVNLFVHARHVRALLESVRP